MLLQKIYSAWIMFAMAVCFFLFVIPLTFCSYFEKFHRQALWINHLWARLFFFLSFIPVKKVWHFLPQKEQVYILCANHFSYLDIPALGLLPYPFKFVGKSQISKIPLFGLIYNRLHIPVNRMSYRSRADSLVKARKEIKKKFGLGVFPEGGIRSQKFPELSSFQDGAFRLACENNVPIIPIIFTSNHQIIWGNNFFSVRRKRCTIVSHHPVYPEGSELKDVKSLKEKVFHIIQSELNTYC